MDLLKGAYGKRADGVQAANLVKGRLQELYYSSSIRSRLSIAFGFLFALLLVLLVIIVYNVTSTILINKAIENTSQNITLASEKFDITFDSVEDYAKTAITNNDIQEVMSKKNLEDQLTSYNDRIKIFAALDSIISLRTLVDSMIIYDFKDRIYDSGKIQNLEYKFQPEYNFFRTFESAGQERWIDTHPSNYIERGSPQNIITLVRGMIDAGSGRSMGVLETNIQEESISKLYKQIKLGESGKIFVVNDQGMVVSHTDKKLLNTSITSQPYYTWTKDTEGGKTFTINHKRFLVISRHYERLHWNIIGLVPINEVIQDQKLLTNRLVLIGILFILAAVIITMWLSNSITKPILKLKQTMKFVADGDLEVRAEVKSKDEIGTLTNEFNRMVRKTSILMDDILEKQKKEEEYELALLQSQINPHFLYNTLESICGLAELNRNEDIIHVVSELAIFYRGVLSKGSKIITLQEELVITESYLKMFKIRYGDQLNYQIEVGEELYRYATVKLLLQPLVENAPIHGLRNKRGSGLITIKGLVEDGRVCLYVIDDGVGMDPEQASQILIDANEGLPKKGFGLASTNKRIKLYFGVSFGLEISSSADGTSIKVTLPMNEVWGDAE